MKKSSNKKLKTFFKIITIIITTLIIIFLLYCLKKGFFSSPEVIVKKVEKFGVLGPVIFLLLQIVQVVLPIIPGGASCLAGVLLFGSIYGFIYKLAKRSIEKGEHSYNDLEEWLKYIINLEI